MKASFRVALTAAGVAAFAAAAVPSVSSAQRVVGPGPDARRVLVTAFRGDPEGGVRAADEIRNRIAGSFSNRVLWATPKKDIDATLTTSGYKPDSALAASDIKELAKLVRADEVIDGTVTRTPAGYRVSTRLFLPRDAALSQPLTTLESADLGDLAKQVVREYDAARKQLPANQDCENAIRAGKIADAIAAARRGIAEYPRSTLARLCLASAFQAQKSTADSLGPWKDSVIAVTREIVNLDKQSRIAYQLQYDAFKAKQDTTNALNALVGLMGADPTNTTLREQVIAELVNSGKAELAVPIAKQLIADNPGDPEYAGFYWRVLRAARNYKESVAAGMAYVTLDSAKADSGYFQRQVFDLAADSAYAKAAEFAMQGVAKFPTNTTLLLLAAQNQRRAGQLPAAKATLERALQINPKAEGAQILVAQIAYDLGNVDDAIKAVRADVASDPTQKARDAAVLLSWGNAAYKAGVASKKSEDFKKAINILSASNELAPSANASFLLGLAGISQAQNAAAAVQASKACADAKEGQDAVVLVMMNMPRGGSVDPATAKQILDAGAQYQTYFDATAKKLCK